MLASGAQESGDPLVNIEGDKVVLGPVRHDLIPHYL